MTSASPVPRSRSASGKNGVYLWAPYGSWPYADMYVTGS